MEYKLTSKELCELLGISQDSLKSRMYRARQNKDNFFDKYYKKFSNILLWTESSVEAIKQREIEYLEMKKRNLVSWRD